MNVAVHMHFHPSVMSPCLSRLTGYLITFFREHSQEIISGVIAVEMEVGPAGGFPEVPVARADDSRPETVQLVECFRAGVHTVPDTRLIWIHFAGIQS